MFVHHFTLDEAAGLLPLVRESCLRIRSLLREHQGLRESLMSARTAATPGAAPARDEGTRERMEELYETAHQELARLHEMGVQVKSLDPFLLDFPALLDGKTVLLCWREGEERIGYFHSVEGGFNARKPIAQGKDFGTPVLH